MPAKSSLPIDTHKHSRYTNTMHSPAHPGEILKEDVLAETGLTIAKAAQILGVGRPALSAVLNGRASLSPQMALRFEKAFGVSMELMLKMQMQYDIARTRRVAEP